jgi:hypothetical protein
MMRRREFFTLRGVLIVVAACVMAGFIGYYGLKGILSKEGCRLVREPGIPALRHYGWVLHRSRW